MLSLSLPDAVNSKFAPSGAPSAERIVLRAAATTWAFTPAGA